MRRSRRKRGTLIRRVHLSQFKSVREPASLDLTKLTVITGSNSSGKSTLLQSLLLLAQTVRHSGSDRQLALNGPLVRLGQFEEVLSRSAKNRTFSIGLEVAPLEEGATRNQQRDLLRRVVRPELVDATWRFTDKPPREGSEGEVPAFPTVAGLELDAFFESENDSGEHFWLKIKRHRWRPSRRAAREGFDDDLPDTSMDGLAYLVTLDPGSTRDIQELDEGGPAKGVVFDHFLPNGILAKIDLNYEIALFIIDVLVGRRSSRSALVEEFGVRGSLLESVREVSVNALSVGSEREGWLSVDFDNSEDDLTAKEVAAWIRVQSPSVKRRISLALRAGRETIAARHAASLEPVNWLNRVQVPPRLRNSLDLVESEINALRYLGPLRVQPSPIYPIASSSGAKDVGPSGEWTASVLDEYKDSKVEHLSPAEVMDGGEISSRSQVKLRVVVDEWLSYLGVSESVHTIDRGSLGHEMKISTDGSPPMSLTHVGVGVSQCLPVVVSLLLAPRGSMTLLEQPELHLHPAVQSRLADFLLVMARAGRQCLVETHSEYLINRLRLRIAESDGDANENDVSIYFADNSSGSTKYNPVEVNSFGAIRNWPVGFFDQTQEDTEALVRAGLKKRKSKGGHAGRD